MNQIHCVECSEPVTEPYYNIEEDIYCENCFRIEVEDKKPPNFFMLCECGHSNEEHKEIDDNYAPCSIHDCSCDDFNGIELTKQTIKKEIEIFENSIKQKLSEINKDKQILSNLRKLL